MRLTIAGPFFDASGYAQANRILANGLLRATVDVRILPMDGNRVPAGMSTEEEANWRSRMVSTPPADEPVVYSGLPEGYFQPGRGCPAVGLTMLESDRIPQAWVRICNRMDQVWVPSSFNASTFAESGVYAEKLRILPLGVDPELFSPSVPAYPLDTGGKFVFASVSEWVPRKGQDILLRAYLNTFTAADPVLLVLKTYDGHLADPGGGQVRRRVAALEKEVGPASGAPAVHLITEPLPASQLPGLYTLADCFVLPTRGEGWCLPALEAMACARPAILTAWSAPLDYLNPENSYPLPVEKLVPVLPCNHPTDGVYSGSRWAEPSLQALCQLLRHACDHRTETAAKGKRARADVLSRFTVGHTAALAKRYLDEASRRGSGEIINVPQKLNVSDDTPAK